MQNFNDFGMGDPWPGLANMERYENDILTPQPHPIAAREQVTQRITYGFPPESPRRLIQSNACEQCKKRRTKCDATKPHCLACTTLHGTPCSYDLEKDHRRKGALRQEILKLKELTTNYQFIIISLCLAEEPKLGELVQLIRSKQPIDVIADKWRSDNPSTPGRVEAARSRNLERVTHEGNYLGNPVGGSGSIQIITNPAGINISHSAAEAGRIIININQAPVQVTQPQLPAMQGTTSGMLGQSGTMLGTTMSAPPDLGLGLCLEGNGDSMASSMGGGCYNTSGEAWPGDAGSYWDRT